ncbi:PAS domain S-box [Synechococcus sp. PCC 7502]|uniref:PAS domain S-box protein n=1 Tax=Synechococcus sp. PCC 7502 TaxID=1173263 RepID=UPI00029F83AA|nr:PAS domain S-box protein [Synechococcus sp. PCC 7502]AFY73500.1 PAS domain S-box [Synechococcus sp. PCC 7502]
MTEKLTEKVIETGDRIPLILIISSKPDFLLNFKLNHIQQCESISEALKLALASRTDQQSQCILLDWELSECSQLTCMSVTTLIEKKEVLQQLDKASQNFVPVLILIGTKQEEKLKEIVTPLHLDYLLKESLSQEFLNFAINQAITKANLNQKLAETERKLQKYEPKRKSSKRIRLKSLKSPEKSLSLYQFDPQILDQVSDAVILIDKDYRVTYCNDSALNQYKLPADKMRGKYLSECYEFKWLNPEDEHRAMAAIETQGYWEGENIHRLLNGEELWVGSRVVTLRDESGNSIGLLATIRNITKQKLAEQSLKESELKLRKLTDNIPVALYQFLLKPDGSMSFPFTSQGTFSLYELTPEAIQADANIIFTLVHPLDVEPLYQSIQISAQTLEPWRWEGRIYTASGKLKWISGISQPELLPNGDILWHGMARDISDRKEYEIALQKSEATNRTMLNAIPDLILRLASDGTCLSYKKSGIGVDNCQPIKNHISEVLTPELLQQQMQTIEQAIATGELQIHEHKHLKPNRIVYEEVRTLAINDQEVLVIVRDISDRKQAEIELKTKTTELDRFFSVSLDLLCIANMDGYLLRLNPSWQTTLGYSLDQLEGSYCIDYVHPEDVKRTLDAIALFNTQPYIAKFVNRYRCRDGSYRWFEWRGASSGNLIYAAARDITDRKQIEEKLRRSQENLCQSEELLKLTIDNTPVGICTFNLENQFLTVNQYLCQILGYSPEELIKKTTLEFSHPSYAETCLAAISRLLANITKHECIEKQYLHKNGTLIDAITRISLIKNAKGEPSHFVATVEDITQRKRTAIALHQRIEYQNVLMTLTQQIRQSLNLNLILETTVTEVKRILNCDRVIIYQLLENGLSKIVQESVNPTYPVILHSSWHDTHLTSEMFEYFINSNILIENNVSEHSFFKDLSEYMQEAKIKSKIIAPIVHHINNVNNEVNNKVEVTRWQRYDKQLWGLLIVHSCGELRHWQPEEAELLEQITNQLAISIQQASLYQQLQNQAKADRIQTEVTLIINQSNSVKEALDLILKKAKDFLQCDRIQIFQLDVNCNGYVLKEEVCCPELSMLNTVFKDSCFAPKDIATEYLNGQVTYINDVENDPNIAPCHAEILRQYQVRANLVAPIILGDSLWGLLLVHQCTEPRYWQPLEISFIQQIGMQISTAVQKENLYLQICNELDQKKILLQEIHHRVKNNLQVMSSILFLQFRNAPLATQLSIEQYQSRLESMALIHDQLYRSDDLSLIDFSSYIHNLTANLLQCYYPHPDLIELNIEVNNVFLSLDQSIPLGLIINELVSNSLKYAFPNQYGRINIQLTKTIPLNKMPISLTLLVSDNGVGIRQDSALDTSQNLGLQLVQSLTEQLEGDISFDYKNGFSVQITFPIT